MRGSLARFMVSACLLPAAAGCNSIYGPTSTDANWHVSSMGLFTLYVRPGSFAEDNLTLIAEVLNDQYSATVASLNLRYQGRITMFLHNSGTEAGFGDDAGGGNHSGVAYPGTETVKTVCVPPLDGSLFSLLSHEANHVIIRNGLGRPGTTFMSEALASAVISERFHASGPTFFHRWVADRRSQLPRIRDLSDDEKWRGQSQSTAYTVSASFLAYVIEAYGVMPFAPVYYASSHDFPGTFAAAYGRTLEQAESEWLAFVSAGRR